MESDRRGCGFETLAHYSAIVGALAGISAGFLVARQFDSQAEAVFAVLLLGLAGGIIGLAIQRTLLLANSRRVKPTDEKPVAQSSRQQPESLVDPAGPSMPQLRAILENGSEITLGLSQESTTHIGRAATMQELEQYLQGSYGITAPDCLIRIPDKPDYEHCSRYHALVQRKDDAYWLYDRSKNGTYLDGIRVPAKGARLSDGSLFALTPPSEPEHSSIRFQFECITHLSPLDSFHDRLYEGLADETYAKALVSDKRVTKRWENAADVWWRIGEDLKARDYYEKAANSLGGRDRARCWEKLAILRKDDKDEVHDYLRLAAEAEGRSLIEVEPGSVSRLVVGDPTTFRLHVTNQGFSEARLIYISPKGGTGFEVEPSCRTRDGGMGAYDRPWQPEFTVTPNPHGPRTLTFRVRWWDTATERHHAVEVPVQCRVDQPGAPPISGEKVFMGPVAIVDGDVGFVRQQAADNPVEAVTTCPHCGEEVPGASFCAYCGGPLHD
ncbi:MAG TPA: FHA domain-containing protein [Anaerolineae bacterium]|nr:FHA domain-containing protein [Anaerolineae bacterium]